MKTSSNFSLKVIVDNFLLINIFLVILSSLYFLFSLIMNIRGNYIFLDFFRKLWNPIILPLITLLIVSALLNGFISWLMKKLPHQEEDI